MNDSEKQTIVFIPRNFIEKGTFMGGMFKIRNAIEGGILAVLIAVPVIQLPLSLTVRIIILCMTALPAAMISLIGIGGESISAFLMNALSLRRSRRSERWVNTWFRCLSALHRAYGDMHFAYLVIPYSVG